MKEREEKEIVRSVETRLGLDSSTAPTWGYDLEQVFFLEEAPTRVQRKFAGSFLRNLSFWIAGYELAAQQGQVPPLVTAQIEGLYDQERQEMRNLWGDQFHDFTLTHVLGAAKRQLLWFEELKQFEETNLYDGMLQRLRSTRAVLEPLVKSRSSHV